MKAISSAIGFLLCLIAATSGHSAVVTWNVTGIFDDGARIGGFFQFDSDKFAATGNGIGNFDILTTRGSVLAGAEYLSGFLISDAKATPLLIDITNSLGRLVLQHAIPLSDAGGLIPLTSGAEDFGGVDSRAIRAGELVGSVPEPSQWMYFILGLTAIVGTMLRMRHRAR